MHTVAHVNAAPGMLIDQSPRSQKVDAQTQQDGAMDTVVQMVGKDSVVLIIQLKVGARMELGRNGP